MPNNRQTNLFALLAVALALAGKTFAIGLLSNAGFESDTNSHNQALFGWQTYGPNVYNEAGAAAAHSGTNYCKVYQAFTGAINYSGVYQDYISGPGATYAADGWAFTAGNDTLAGQNQAWLEITFRDASANVLALYRSAIVTSNTISSGKFPKNAWNHLLVTNQYDPNSYAVTNTAGTLVAPPGTFFVRCQITFQGDSNYSGGSVCFDDLNLVSTGGSPYGNFNITWDDEFDATNLNTNIWTFDLGGGGWGNSEQEFYTGRTNNAYVADGCLHIVARQEATNGYTYTSARVKSQGFFAVKYGRIEWRAQLPAGTGCWPALWLLGTNITGLGWPGCGEIDVMENNGGNPFMVQGSIHSGSDATAVCNFTDGNAATNGFHTYTVDWTTNAILFYVDGHLYEAQTSWSSSTANAYPFPFNQPFYLLMNLAIGGSYLGYPNATSINAGTTFPSEMLVDYVRVYNATDPLRLTFRQSGKNLTLGWPSNIMCSLQLETNLTSQGIDTNWQVQKVATNSFQIMVGFGSGAFRLRSP
jgi:beta-glucanase (GH16 family)